MTDPNRTELAVILDRSGSMEPIRADMEGGFKAFVEAQRKEAGTCVLSLYQFDDQYDIVYEEKPLSEIRGLRLRPRGSTALLDALVRSIGRIGERLAKKPAHERPGAVIVMVITDGHENASTEVTSVRQVRALIGRKERKYDWRFVYLGADARAIDDANALGIASAAIYSPTAEGVCKLYASTTEAISGYRSAVRHGKRAARIEIDRDLT